MEILSYVLDGALGHQDDMGNGSTIVPGDVQRMSAGTGVRHSEQNASRTAPVHFLQIWIMPDKSGHKPGYEQRAFPASAKQGKLCVVASPDGRDGSLTIHQDTTLSATLLAPGERVVHPLAADRFAWIQVTRGEIEVGGHTLQAGDGAAIRGGGELALTGKVDAEALLFDLA
jgi:redox-sensitive bicupin YhaK (pirin superfamily)